MRIDEKQDNDVIEISEEVKITQEDGSVVILEAGDKIQVQEAQQLDVAKEAIQKFIDDNKPMPVADLKKVLRML